MFYAISSTLQQEVSSMPTVWVVCADAVLRERLLRCFRDAEQMTVYVKPCVADAVVAVQPVWCY
jgi:hypothetical protein